MDKWVLILILSVVTNTAIAQDSSNTETQPSIEMLEFLGEWETSNGEWIDPIQFMEMSENEWLMQEGEEEKHD